MSFQDFLANPWKNSAPAYEEGSFFKHHPSPEYATGEVLLSSLYRVAGFDGYGEKGVPAAGREFSRRLQSAGAHEASGSSVSIAEWNVVMEGILESPKQANQSTRRLLQMSPIVPDICEANAQAHGL